MLRLEHGMPHGRRQVHVQQGQRPERVAGPLPTGVEVQIEATYNLQNAVGFAATSEGAIASMYASLGESTTSVLKNDVFFSAAFGVDTANVGIRSASAPVVTQTPQPTPVPPPPATPAPTPAIPAPTPSSGNSLCVSMTSALAALLVLALFW